MVNRACSPPASKRGRPPKAIEKFAWKKGCACPNPGGRPKTGEIGAMARAILAEEHPRTRKTGLERLTEAWFRRAMQGDTRKGEILLAYSFGKPLVQTLNVNENTNTGEMSVEEAKRIIQNYFGTTLPACAPDGQPTPDLEAVRKRVEELLEKRQKKTIVEPPITAGSEAVQ